MSADGKRALTRIEDQKSEVVMMQKEGARLRQEEYVTAEEYLAFDKSSEIRNEYVAGEIVAMTGASREHNLISHNVSRELGVQLRGKPSETS